MKYKLLTEYKYSDIKPFVKYILSLCWVFKGSVAANAPDSFPMEIKSHCSLWPTQNLIKSVGSFTPQHKVSSGFTVVYMCSQTLGLLYTGALQPYKLNVSHYTPTDRRVKLSPPSGHRRAPGLTQCCPAPSHNSWSAALMPGGQKKKPK